MSVEQIVKASAGLLSRGRWDKQARCFSSGREYSAPMVRRMIRAEHQVRQLAAELKLADDDDHVLQAWWMCTQSEDKNVRRTIPPDCHRGRSAINHRPRKDDQFLCRDQRLASAAAVARHHAALVRELAEKYQPGSAAAG
jgi:hypothetical protein